MFSRHSHGTRQGQLEHLGLWVTPMGTFGSFCPFLNEHLKGPTPPAEPTADPVVGRNGASSCVKSSLPSQLRESPPQQIACFVRSPAQARGKKPLLVHATMHCIIFFFPNSNTLSSTYWKKRLYWLKTALHVEIRWLVNWCPTGPFAECISTTGSFSHWFANCRKPHCWQHLKKIRRTFVVWGKKRGQ